MHSTYFFYRQNAKSMAKLDIFPVFQLEYCEFGNISHVNAQCETSTTQKWILFVYWNGYRSYQGIVHHRIRTHSYHESSPSFDGNRWVQLLETTTTKLLEMVFCYQNCSDLLWEKIVLVIEKNFFNSRLKAENLQNFEITRIIYSNSERSGQFSTFPGGFSDLTN